MAARGTGPGSWLLLLTALSGCAVGLASVDSPSPARAESPPVLPGEVSFDVALPWRGGQTDRWEERIRKAFAGQGIRVVPTRSRTEAQLGTHFWVSWTTATEHPASIILSFLTLSAIPGYGVERTRYDVDVEYRDAAGNAWRDHLQYEDRIRYFVWLPLIVHPDFIGSINGGWTSEKVNSGLERVVGRLAADLGAGIRRGPPRAAARIGSPTR